MSEKIENDSYNEIFETARLNTSMRIQQLNESAQLAATQSVVAILRPNINIDSIRTVPRPVRTSTNKPMHPSGGSASS